MLLLPVFAQPQPAAIDARQAYSQIYASAAWRLRPGQPLSGGGSTLEATNVTCSVLSRAVLFAASQRGYGQPVRILDAPCGDWNWMPSCLSRIAKGVGRGTSIVYRGVDVVDDLISTLNARRGDSLLSEQWSARVRLLPFLRADITNATEMAQFRGAVDVILHKHMIAHTPNALITLALRALDGLGAMMLVHDNHPTTSRMSVRDTVVAGAHDVDLHVGPFHLEPPLCAERDAGLCAAEGKCVDRIEIARLPLRRMRPVPSLGKRQALMAAVLSCDSVHYASAVAQAAKRGDPFDATTLQQLKRYYQELGLK